MRDEGKGEVKRTSEFLVQVTRWFGVPTIEKNIQEGEASLVEGAQVALNKVCLRLMQG